MITTFCSAAYAFATCSTETHRGSSLQRARIGPVEGHTTETLRDGRGNPVGGLVFNILFGVLEHTANQFQVVQRADGSVVMKVIPMTGPRLPAEHEHAIRGFADKYLPGAPFAIEYVTEIPLTPAGKRKVVIVEH